MVRANYWEKDMQTNKERKIHYKLLKKSRNRKSVSRANIFGSFFLLIQFHMLRVDPIFRADGFCLSIKHFFSAVLTSFSGRNAELCLIWKLEKPALETFQASWNSCFLKSHLFQDRYTLLKSNKWRPTDCCSWLVLQPGAVACLLRNVNCRSGSFWQK